MENVHTKIGQMKSLIIKFSCLENIFNIFLLVFEILKKNLSAFVVLNVAFFSV